MEHPEDSRPHIYFGLLWTDEWWQHLVTETNRYAEAQGANAKWSPVNVVEMRAFIGRCIAFNVLYGFALHKVDKYSNY